MPPATPAKKDAPDKGARKGASRKSRKRTAAKVAPKKTALCHTCGSRIRIPDGWTIGPAVRRHYWAKHRTVMQPERKSGR